MRTTYVNAAILLLVGIAGLAFLPERVGAQSYSCRSRSSYATSYYSYPTYSSYSYAPAYAPTYSYYEPKAYKEEVRIKEIVIPSFLQIPLYGAYYTPPVYPPVQGGGLQPAAAPGATNPAPATLPTAPTAGTHGKAPCADVTARVDNLEGKLNQILKALEGGSAPSRGVAPATAPVAPSAPTPSPALAPPVKKEAAAAVTDEVERTALAGVKLSCSQCHDDTNAALPGKKGTSLGGGFVMTKGGKFDPALTSRQWVKILGKLSIKQMPPEKDQDGKPVRDLTEQEYAALNVFALRKGGV